MRQAHIKQNPLPVRVTVIDSGALPAAENMAIDRDLLAATGEADSPMLTLRFFRWKTDAVTFGYLMEEAAVAAWAKAQRVGAPVRRPTGGGVVLHGVGDLSLSLVWRRGRSPTRVSPAATYRRIHEALLTGLRGACTDENPHDGHGAFSLAPAPHNAPARAGRMSLCYEEPVENDILWGGRKCLGGALRVMRQAVLYQGNIKMGPGWPEAELKGAIADAVRRGVVVGAAVETGHDPAHRPAGGGAPAT